MAIYATKKDNQTNEQLIKRFKKYWRKTRIQQILREKRYFSKSKTKRIERKEAVKRSFFRKKRAKEQFYA